ncbi:mannose-P-dolichol utilization defect 1 protein-like [Corythoichthys intestinalis]|uniref:mannose-P-dolichol utilization defect 1 protein-like n=1 Tax=Corythoichthys intestinalis TaxID=161448 RepID=UPI0025A610C3|nr:mannose-P-dolichol utilization defect 1 protein-like [Corythoichthys intestinalis]XP_061801209.1 mannose-P-dolichol utilization defect 1 protein-like [Nerophis lumbriciformis]
MSTSPVKDFLVTNFMPEKCYEELFVDLNLHVPCLTLVFKKIFGVWILLDVLFAQLLQLLKILWRLNAEGLSPASILLQLYASSGPVLFAMAHKFPILAWGERLFLSIQTAMILFLILHYRGETNEGILLVLLYGGLIVVLGSYAPANVISAMQSTSLAAIIASKVFQAVTNYNNGSTGQLSFMSILLSCIASLGLAFISLQGTGKSFETLGSFISGCFSCILLAQVLCYGRRKTKAKKA